MSISTKFFISIIFLLTGFVSLGNYSALAADGVTLYTPFTKISVPPGESVDYTIDVHNEGDVTRNVDVYVSGLPKSWDYELKSGGWNIKQLSILPGQKKSLSLKVEVPYRVNKGNYMFRVIAKNHYSLPLVVNVSEQGTFKTEFTSEQANMEGHSRSTFTFKTTLKNRTGNKQLYSLRANAPRGWTVTFKPNYKQATAVEIESDNSTDITIEIKPPHNIMAGTYKIPVGAVTSTTSAQMELEVVITGSYNLNLTTPTGLLSTSITAGNDKRIELILKNTGSAELKDIRFSASKPKNWEVTFNPDTVSVLEAGKIAQVYATIKASNKAIPGDYVANITAQTPETSSAVAFRVSVKTSILWGWLGILIIIAVIGSVYYFFRKYGRR
ncbi:MAG: hypothetical protein JSV22_05885 [Bacteroidales bacterium]|nr:MAG: hypothetical protein JSV22_05885 [Bacteroidales bacterium]